MIWEASTTKLHFLMQSLFLLTEGTERYPFNLSSEVAEASRSLYVQDQLSLQSKFQAPWEYIPVSVSKTMTANRKQG